MRRFSTLQIALAFSLGLHGALLSLRIAAPDAFNRMFQDTPLEVVLVNARSTEPPPKAAALAQANLAGGGNTETGRATSPLPPARQRETGDAVEAAHTQITQLQQQQQQLLTQVRRELALLPPPDPRREKSDPNERAQAEKRRRAARADEQRPARHAHRLLGALGLNLAVSCGRRARIGTRALGRSCGFALPRSSGSRARNPLVFAHSSSPLRHSQPRARPRPQPNGAHQNA